MVAVPATLAGCPERVLCTPPAADGNANAAVLVAARRCGVTKVFKSGGAQAVAAMAYGTASIPKTDKIFGPGTALTTAAKQIVAADPEGAACDLPAGPSEVLVIADGGANPAFVAADLLAQAEHGSGHERVWLITTSTKMLKAVEKEIAKQLPMLARREFIQRALDNNGWLIQAESLDAAVALVNQLAPEHCEVMTRNARKVSERILTAGAIFLGPCSPTVLGDYVAGPSHTLPTGGAGASFAGLTVDQFQRRTSVVEYTRASLKKGLPAVKKFAELEGLGAHGQSAEVRLD
jgi:histidinol dehydrogenase